MHAFYCDSLQLLLSLGLSLNYQECHQGFIYTGGKASLQAFYLLPKKVPVRLYHSAASSVTQLFNHKLNMHDLINVTRKHAYSMVWYTLKSRAQHTGREATSPNYHFPLNYIAHFLLQFICTSPKTSLYMKSWSSITDTSLYCILPYMCIHSSHFGNSCNSKLHCTNRKLLNYVPVSNLCNLAELQTKMQ